jgi:hypothetical protein
MNNSTAIVVDSKLPPALLAELDREIVESGENLPYLPLKPFTAEAELKYMNFKPFGVVSSSGQAEKEGFLFVFKLLNVTEAEFASAKHGVIGNDMRAGLEYCQIYFTKHPNMTYSLDEQARFRTRLLQAVGGEDSSSAQTFAALRDQEISVPIRITRTWVRKTGGSKNNPTGTDLFNDTYELIA